MKKQDKTIKEKETEKINDKKINKKKIILYIVGLAIVIYLLYTIYLLIKEPTNIVTVEEGKLYQEETDIGYIIRNEKVVKGNNYKNCSSDTKTRDTMTRHFCHECALKVEEMLKNLCNESEDK